MMTIFRFFLSLLCCYCFIVHIIVFSLHLIPSSSCCHRKGGESILNNIKHKKDLSHIVSMSLKGSNSKVDRINKIHNHISKKFDLTRFSLFSKLTFAWAKDILDYGNLINKERSLDLNDVWQLADNRNMTFISPDFQYYLTKEMELSKDKVYKRNNILQEYWSYAITRALVKMFRRDFIISGLLKFVNTCVQFLPSIFISKLLKLVTSINGNKNLISSQYYLDGIIISVLLYLSLNAKTIIENLYFYVVINLGSSVRGVLSCALFQKALKLSPSGRQDFTTGEIVNYMQLDTGRMEQVAGSIHTVWDGLFQIFGYTALLLYFLGPAVFAGVLAMLLILPLNAYFLKRLSELRVETLKYTDYRVKLTNEILQGIRAIKSYNWEIPFLQQLAIVRDKEINAMKVAANSRAILVSILSAAPSFVAALTLSVYALLGNELSPIKVFTALGLFNQLRFPIIFFPLLLNSLADGKISLARISKYLNAQEIQNYVFKESNINTSVAIEISNGIFSWKNQPKKTTNEPINNMQNSLHNISMSIKQGQLIGVVGSVGSGKSMLLSSMLGELSLINGSVKVNGRVAYVPQNAWIPNNSLKEVILFGKEYNKIKYDEAIQSSGLRKDISALEYGDETEIGERGINLSGGQRQRVSIARAIYDDADVYLFDDPLSALDAEVGLDVFENCILGTLKNKTRILVTHQLKVLSQVDQVIIMNRLDDGTCAIVDKGSLSELNTRGYNLSKLINKTESIEAIDDTSLLKSDNPIEDINDSNIAMNVAIGIPSLIDSCKDVLELTDESPVANTKEETLPSLSNTIISSSSLLRDNLSKVGSSKLISVEERAEGAVSLKVYKHYIASAKKPLLLLGMLFSFFIANFSQLGQQFIVSQWTSDVGYKKYSLYAYLFGIINAASSVAIFNWSRTYLAYIIGAESSRKLHYDMLQRVLHAPLSFFEATPIGRLVSRFSKDLDSIDQQLPSSIGQLVASGLNIIGAMFAVCVVTPSFMFFMIPTLLIYFNITNFYRNVARDLKRLESISRSPIYAHFSETLGGLSVIRSFAKETLYYHLNQWKVNDNLSSYFSLKAIDRWLSVRLELLGNLIVFASGLLAIVSGTKAGSTGLSLNNALSITSLLNWAVRNFAETESLMNSVERVLYTTNETPSELSLLSHSSSTTNNKIQSNVIWPNKGKIEFKNVHMRYRPDYDFVLRNVSLIVNPGERIGVVGRTGSGKSTLFRALLRLTDMESGAIEIDDLNIRQVDLDVLRSGISIIPQDPVLFSGTIRMNIDPFNRLSDEEIWNALRKSNLESTIRSFPNGLSYEVSENGENLSQGQRQLLCLTRALVRQSKILLLDEATSSIDFDSDVIIQKTIREEFSQKGCTVLTIAHRIDTILDANKILVMNSHGLVGEYDTPTTLLKNTSSLFYQLYHAEQSTKTHHRIV